MISLKITFDDFEQNIPNLVADISEADLEKEEFRVGRADDFISLSTKVNYIKWDALANGSPFAYSTFNFGESADADFDTAVVSHQFDTKGVFKVKQKVFLVTWYLGDFLEDSSEVTITVNSALSLDAQKALNGLAIYPNPVANELNVSFNANSDATIELVNLAGQVIATKNASAFANVTFDTAEINAGVYFINIKVAEGTFTQKVIKD
jgi:hypothetical protein